MLPGGQVGLMACGTQRTPSTLKTHFIGAPGGLQFDAATRGDLSSLYVINGR